MLETEWTSSPGVQYMKGSQLVSYICTAAAHRDKQVTNLIHILLIIDKWCFMFSKPFTSFPPRTKNLRGFVCFRSYFLGCWSLVRHCRSVCFWQVSHSGRDQSWCSRLGSTPLWTGMVYLPLAGWLRMLGWGSNVSACCEWTPGLVSNCIY